MTVALLLVFAGLVAVLAASWLQSGLFILEDRSPARWWTFLVQATNMLAIPLVTAGLLGVVLAIDGRLQGSRVCSGCGAPMPSRARFCGTCGARAE